jgi:hypothetical protein
MQTKGFDMSLRFGQRWLVGFLSAWSCVALAQSIPVGRSSLTLPDPARWGVSSLPANDPSYSGDSSGTIPMDNKRLVLRSPTGAIQAVALVRVTKSGIAGTQMSWGNGCKGITTGPYLFKRDRSSTTNVDCLLVVSIGQPAAFLASVPALKQALDGNLPGDNGFYLIEYTVSIGSGGYMQAQMLVAPDFIGLEGVPVEQATQMPTPVIAWAEAFATSSRPAIGSISGQWTVPPLAFSAR